MRIDLRISARFRLLLLLYVALALSMTATSIVACGVVLDSGNLTDSLAALFGVVVEMYVGELLPIVVAHDKTRFLFLDRPRRREAAGGRVLV